MADGLSLGWALVVLMLGCSVDGILALTKHTSQNRDVNHNCSAVNESSTSIRLRWPAPTGGQTHEYLIKYWPVYSPDSIQNITTNQQSVYHVNGLEVQTWFQFTILKSDDNGHQWSRICSVFGKTGQHDIVYPVHGLRAFIINKTVAYITWKRSKVPGISVSYRAYMEWGLETQPKAALVFVGNKTNAVIKRKKLPNPVRFHVNVLYNSMKTSMITTTREFPTVPSTGPSIGPRPARLVLSVIIYGWDFIHVEWSPVSLGRGNVTYRVQYKTTAQEHQVMTSEDSVILSGLQQFTAYLLRVQAQRDNSDVTVTSDWISMRTADQDECSSDRRVCHVNATCINSRGSYLCRCHDGLNGDGHVCMEPKKIAPASNFCPKQLENHIMWPRTERGLGSRELCPEGTTGIATRRCDEDLWRIPDMSQCVSNEIENIHKELEGPDVRPILVAEKLVRSTASYESKALYPGDLKLIISALNILSRDSMQRLVGQHPGSRDQDGATKLSKAVLQSSSNILDPRRRSSWKYMSKESAAEEVTKLIAGLDVLALHLARGVNTTQPIVTRTSNVVLSVRGIPTGDDLTDQRLPQYADMREGYTSSVTVPAGILRTQNARRELQRHLTFVSYRTIKDLIQLRSQPRLQGDINSEVVSVTLTPLEKNEFDEPVIITIMRSKEKSSGEPTCVFLNVTKDDRLSWSKKGCEIGWSNTTQTECRCYHLTSFAILMQVNNEDGDTIEMEHRFALRLITYVGVTMSLVALIVVFLTFSLLRFLRSPRHFIHANLALSLALAETTFLFGVDRTEHKVVCKILAITLHYLFLVAFAWMALEGVVLYMMLVKVFHSSVSGRKTKLIFFACAWGIPAIVVAISSAVYYEGYGTEKFCWLSVDRHFIWAFVAPVLAVIAFNFVCLGRTFYVMATHGNTGKEEGKIDKIRYWARSCCLLTCILGVTWLLGIFFVNKDTLIMAYLFSILNALQGLMIFLLHCIGDRKIRNAYLRLLQCGPDPLTSYSGAGRLVNRSSISRSSSTRDPSTESRRNKRRLLVKQSTVTSLLKSPGVAEKAAAVPLASQESGFITPYSEALALDDNMTCSMQQEEVDISKPTTEERGGTIPLFTGCDQQGKQNSYGTKPSKGEWV